MARAVMATPAAAEGIDAGPADALAVASGVPDFAAGVTDLLNDPARRSVMGAAARAQMLARYGWDARLAPLADLLQLAPGGAGGPGRGAP